MREEGDRERRRDGKEPGRAERTEDGRREEGGMEKFRCILTLGGKERLFRQFVEIP